MDNIAPSSVGAQPDIASSKMARVAQTRPESKQRPDAPQESGPKVSVADAAADAAMDKAKSINTLASVTESIEDAVEILNEALSRKNTSAQIRRDDELNRFLVTIKDKDSGEIVREIPDEALLKFARNLEELKGILFDQTL